ncbi:MAG: SiaB family protein kinase [Flavobacteriales bacterium]|nr:SiaB family protein kinase [Flavobacteriales bacterium]
MIDIFDFYDKMQRSNIMLSFKGEITSELLGSILQIMENKLENINEEPKVKKKVFNVLVECLQNLYHHLDVEDGSDLSEEELRGKKSAIFMIGRENANYYVMTGNYILTDRIKGLKERLDKINSMSKEELKDYYKEVLNNDEFSAKGGGGLGMIDIARKTGQKLDYFFKPVDDTYSFFSLHIKIVQ